jgi:hypothetical protein
VIVVVDSGIWISAIEFGGTPAPVQTLDQLRKRGAQLVGEVVQYQDSYRLC